jgi:hypothetical protein
MKWIIILLVIVVVAFWFIKRVYSSTERKQDNTQGIGSGENGVGVSDAGANDGE